MASPASGAIVNVFLVGGQSNALGRANTAQLPTSPLDLKSPQNDVAFYEGSLTTLQPRATQFGPEITFGRALADHYSPLGESVALLKYAVGGTNLHTQWKADGTSSPTSDGSHYKAFQNTVNAGLLALATSNPGDTFVLSGMIWMQGESDAVATHSANYETNLTNFINDIRATFEEELPFVIGQLSSGQTNLNATYLNTVRTAQANVAAADSLTALLDTSSYSLANDNLHFDAAGQIAMGYGFADSMLTLMAKPIPEPSALSFASLALGLLITRRRK